MFCPDAVAAYAASLRTGRAIRRDGHLALRSSRSVSVTKTKDVFKDKGTSLPPASQSTCPCRHGQCCALPTWWSWRGGCTRSHSEHGRETPQRRWYFVSRRGRVGRCQVCKAQLISSHLQPQNTGPLSAALFAFRHETIPSWPVAGWSSPVARQAHNLKVAGSNPAPATKFQITKLISRWRESVASAGEVAPRPADHNLKSSRCLLRKRLKDQRLAGSNPDAATI